MDTVSIPYAYRMDTVFSKLETWCKNKNKKEKEEPKKNKKKKKKKNTHKKRRRKGRKF